MSKNKIEFDGDRFTVETPETVIPGRSVTVYIPSSYQHVGGCTKKWKGEYDDETRIVTISCKHCGAAFEFEIGSGEPEGGGI